MSKIERILEDSFKDELLTPITFLRGVAASRNVYAKLGGGMVIFYEDVNEELNFLQNWRVDDLGSVDIHTTENCSQLIAFDKDGKTLFTFDID